MKTNLILFSVLCFLLTFTYFFEERGYKKSGEVKSIDLSLLELTDIQSVKLKKTSLIFDGEIWIVDQLKYNADPTLVKNVFYIFENIKVIKKINVQDNDFSEFFKYQKHEFSLINSNGESKYILGDVSEATGNFYILKNGKEKELFLCKDTSLVKGIYKNEKEGKLSQYLNLKNILTAGPQLFINKNLMSRFKLNHLASVKIDSNRNRWFELFLNENKTQPQAPKGIEYLKVKEKLLSRLMALQIKKVRLQGQSILSGLKSTLYLNLVKDGKIHTEEIKLYGALNGEIGRFVKIKDTAEIFEIEELGASLFYAHVQEFWNKRLQWKKKLSSLKEIPLKVGTEENKLYDFKVVNLKTFEMQFDKRIKAYNKNKFNFLFNLTFNLADFSQAKFVETITDKEALKRIKEQGIFLNILEHELKIIIKKSVIEILDRKTQTLYTYIYNSESLGENILDHIFTLKEK